MAFDERRGRLVLFGGFVLAGKRILDDTWEWDGTRWEERHPPVRPRPRQGARMVSYGGRLVLFGGQIAGAGSQADTWTWDGERWEPLDLDPAPPARHRHGMGVDPERGVLVLFGGRQVQPPQGAEEGRNEFLNDTWELTLED